MDNTYQLRRYKDQLARRHVYIFLAFGVCLNENVCNIILCLEDWIITYSLITLLQCVHFADA